MYKHLIIVYLIIAMFLVPGLLGCEGKTKPIDKPEIVSNKIVGVTEQKQNTESETRQTPETSDSVNSEKNNQEGVVIQSESNASEVLDHKKQIQKSDNSSINDSIIHEDVELLTAQNNLDNNDKNIYESTNQNMVPPGSKIQDSLTEINNSIDEDKRKAAGLLVTLHQEASIFRKGSESSLDLLSNPFLPLFSDEPLNTQSSQTKKAKKVRPEKELTPLEKVDLSQLKLVATLRAGSGNKALVEDSTGKGYVINKGTYIGINSGSVVEITNESVIVEEEIETLTGDVKIQKREIKLQKAPGE